jgi:hypothetical protein
MLQDHRATVGWATGRLGAHAANHAVSARWHGDAKCWSTRGAVARCVHRWWRPSGVAARGPVRAATSTGRLFGRPTDTTTPFCGCPSCHYSRPAYRQHHSIRYFSRVTPNATVLFCLWDFEHLVSQQLYKLMATCEILLCQIVTNCLFFKTRNRMCQLLDL